MKLRNWLLGIFGICGLIGIRMVESTLFYDPFLQYFREANKQMEIPDFVWSQIILHHLFRFCLNLIFSAIILQGFFNHKKWTIQGIFLMLLVFAITFCIYLYCLYSKLETGYLFTFYVRRFVIQPIILLLIIPSFYYRKQMFEVKN